MSSLSDREALLAAINETVSGLKKPVNMQQQLEALSKSKVNQNMQRDLVSHASKAADLRDFKDDENLQTKATLNSLKGRENESKQREDDLRSNRSLKSEFDYESKRKFVDILGKTAGSELNRLRRDHDLRKSDKDSLPAASRKSAATEKTYKSTSPALIEVTW